MRASRLTNAALLALLPACVAAAQTTGERERPAGSTATRQPPAASPRRPAAKEARDAKSSAAEARARRERRAAVAILLEAERDSASLEYTDDRAAVLASCADALWDADEPRARSVFLRAWETATEADEDEFTKETAAGFGDLPERCTHARETVLMRAARRDSRMAEGWLRALNEWLDRHDVGARNGAGPDVSSLKEYMRGSQRLALASSLLEAGDYAAASRIAAPPARGAVSDGLVEFLLNLRARAPEEADRLFVRLTVAARASASAGANDVLLLSSYVLTPRLLVAVDRDGSMSFRALGTPGVPSAAQGPGAAARATFFETAAAILLRPAGEAEAPALYFAIGRLLPAFEREAPKHVPALNAHMAALASGLEAQRMASLDAGMTTQDFTPMNPPDPLRYVNAGQDETDVRGDGYPARARAVADAARRKLWERARRLADEAKSEPARAAARSLIAIRQIAALSEAYADGEADDFEKAAAFARRAEMSPSIAPAVRAYGLAEAAELAARRGNLERAAALLDEAIAYAQHGESSQELRAAALLMVAARGARIAPSRMLETLPSAVAAFNACADCLDNVADFGYGGSTADYLPEEPQMLREIFEPYTVERAFGEAGALAPSRAAAEARNFEDGVSRDSALIAVARAVLRPKARGAVGPR